MLNDSGVFFIFIFFFLLYCFAILKLLEVLKCIFDSSSTANPVTLNELAKFPLLHVEDEALNPPV